MLNFKSISWKNFLSTGDTPVVIKLDTKSSTLIVGMNGSGKSTMLDAISFGLFGKPHRDIKKNQLINSINDRECLVVVEFSIGSSSYVVKRGIKPNIFEIWQNGTLLNQDSHSRDYQRVLEQNILKLNHKSFHQIVMLGSSSFIPFMQLQTQHRREVIENLLDINIFTKMNQLLKERIAKLRDLLGTANYESELVEEKIRLQNKYIEDLKSLDADQHSKHQEKITELGGRVTALIEENTGLMARAKKEFSTLQADREAANLDKQKLVTRQSQIKTGISAVVKEARFYDDNDECPTCAQPIQLEFKESKKMLCRKKASDLSADQDQLKVDLDVVNKRLVELDARTGAATELNSKLLSNSVTIKNLQTQISDLELELTTKSNADIATAEVTLKDHILEQKRLGDLKNSYYEDGTYNQAISEMLKDTGIKTKVIRQYLPIMNKLINGYLQVLDFFVSFNLDENFEEVIKSRHRDDFSYASFSEGEKQRIDLALLFTWRQIARMKNSVSTNLLILDETFDSSMDTDGVENLLKILSTLETNTSVFVISHKTDALVGKFQSQIIFTKERNFSTAKMAQ